jgi:hypothetical protein
VAGYDCNTFERPQISAEYLRLDGRIRKPDIVFALSGIPRPGSGDGLYDGLFVECKIIDSGSRTVAEYCRNGLNRFVDGSYAWRMREGMMLAYVRTSQSLPADLDNSLVSSTHKVLLNVVGELKPCSLTHSLPQVFISTHERHWSYIDGGIPGPIEVRHLWVPLL